MKIVNTAMPKLCHARPGDVVQLLNHEGEPDGPPYVVSIFWGEGQKQPSKPGRGMSGLYNVRAPLFLVDLETGCARSMPHLSERVCLIDAQLVVPGDAPEEPPYYVGSAIKGGLEQ